ncbi:DIP1984 family protein [Paenibacillus sp. L3-i20]|uniref:DIP1984 family protein n=1 Tax=Paenibacillus sp. L3-i20 TaxID=2905833 RepID=UPI001EDEA4A5|nr:DIP1984 family protein [Paenibacillus sp. L3-i20]GKU78049.1 hypothetical protein L3i20_v224460 [Paenibacillus sp. L3-i20]
MKLAEALVHRVDCQRKIIQLKTRIQRVVKVQEGDAPDENPELLLIELEKALLAQTEWVKKINKTNALTPFNNELSLADALAERDQFMQQRKLLDGILEIASIKQDPYSRSEIKFERTVNIQQIQSKIDELSKQYRERDFRIQELNWAVELIEK